jgi:hypothetical protein
MSLNSSAGQTAAKFAAVLMLVILSPGELAAQGQPVKTASHLPVALWFISAGVLGLVLAYGIMRNRQRTRAEKQITEQATKDLYDRESRKSWRHVPLVPQPFARGVRPGARRPVCRVTAVGVSGSPHPTWAKYSTPIYMPDARKMLAHKSPARQTPFDPVEYCWSFSRGRLSGLRTPFALPFHLAMNLRMIVKRRRFKQTKSLEERLAEDTARLREQATMLPAGRMLELVQRRIVQNEAASDLCERLRSPW